MKTEYRIIKNGIYKYLQYNCIINFIFITFIRWKYIPNFNNPSKSPLSHNKYITNDNTDLDAFINKYGNIYDYLKRDYPLLKQKSLQEFKEFQDEAWLIY